MLTAASPGNRGAVSKMYSQSKARGLVLQRLRSECMVVEAAGICRPYHKRAKPTQTLGPRDLQGGSPSVSS